MCKQNIAKNIVEKRERQCENRNNISKICVSKKDKKCLHKQDTAKIIKLEKGARQCQRRKNMQKICASIKGKNDSVQKINEFTENEDVHVKNIKNYRKQQVLKIVKEKERIKEEQRRNCNTLQINTNLKSTDLRKKLHVCRIFQKQNLANTLKSYVMSNLQTKYKILQRAKIM